MAELPATHDRIDARIADGVLGGAQLNAADFMVVPSLALMLYLRCPAPVRGPPRARARRPASARAGIAAGDATRPTLSAGLLKPWKYVPDSANLTRANLS